MMYSISMSVVPAAVIGTFILVRLNGSRLRKIRHGSMLITVIALFAMGIWANAMGEMERASAIETLARWGVATVMGCAIAAPFYVRRASFERREV